jgi:hypothetical protein
MRVSYRSAFLLSGGKNIEADAPVQWACPESTLYKENESRTGSTERWLRKRTLATQLVILMTLAYIALTSCVTQYCRMLENWRVSLLGRGRKE